MKASRLRLLLWSATALLGAATALVIAWAVLAPYPNPIVADSGSRGRPSGAPRVPADPPVEAFAKVWDVDLGRPLVDPRPPPAPVTQPGVVTPPSLSIKLVGTVVEPGYSMAIFARPDGKTEWKSVGEKSGGIEVLGIEIDRVTLRYNGAPIVLRVERVARVEKGPKR